MLELARSQVLPLEGRPLAVFALLWLLAWELSVAGLLGDLQALPKERLLAEHLAELWARSCAETCATTTTMATIASSAHPANSSTGPSSRSG